MCLLFCFVIFVDVMLCMKKKMLITKKKECVILCDTACRLYLINSIIHLHLFFSHSNGVHVASAPHPPSGTDEVAQIPPSFVFLHYSSVVQPNEETFMDNFDASMTHKHTHTHTHTHTQTHTHTHTHTHIYIYMGS